MQFSLDTVRAVTRLLQESDLSEISLETTDCDCPASRLTVRRQAPARTLRRQPVAALEYSGTGSAAENSSIAVNDTELSALSGQDNGGDRAKEDETITVSATAVGMFRCTQPPLKLGDSVKLGQVIGVVESLKIPNEVIAPISGQVVEVLAQEGQAVEYGQSLLTLNPLTLNPSQ